MNTLKGKGTAAKKPRAAIYVRISKDREDSSKGVDRQELDCQALAKREGLRVVGVFVDNDQGASTRSTSPRPAYAEMLAGARTGQFDVIVAYSNSRLTRRMREFEDLIDLHERFGTRIMTVVSGNDDLSTADGRTVGRLKASIDVGEAERISERVRREKEEAARLGTYRGGQRPFGFEKDGVTLRESEAELIREATTAVLAGRSMGGIVKEWNDAGVLTSKGREWNVNRLRDMLLRPRNAGLSARGLPGKPRGNTGTGRLYDFEVIGKAVWPAIVDEDTWRAFVTLVTDPSRRRANHSTQARWLLSGVARCGIEWCGAVMRPQAHGGPKSSALRKSGSPQRKPLYRCSRANHLTINAENSDKFVLDSVAELLRDPRLIAALAPTAPDMTPDRMRREELHGRLQAVEHDYLNDDIDGPMYRRKKAKIDDEIAEIDERLAEASHRAVASPILSAADPGQEFLDAQLDIKKAIIASVVSVRILPSNRAKGRVFDTGRIELAPVTADDAG